MANKEDRPRHWVTTIGPGNAIRLPQLGVRISARPSDRHCLRPCQTKLHIEAPLDVKIEREVDVEAEVGDTLGR